jgi:hypothetical protein
MGLREIESTLPPGFRFYPSDEELVCHYLYKKVANERAAQGTLVEVDLHAREPWELPGDSSPLSRSAMHDYALLDLPLQLSSSSIFTCLTCRLSLPLSWLLLAPYPNLYASHGYPCVLTTCSYSLCALLVFVLITSTRPASSPIV